MITLVDYDPGWPAAFEEEATRLRDALGPLARRIEHNGSTSIPGMLAKPVIDIQISVAKLEPLSAYGEPLGRLGYSHTPHPDDAVCPFFKRPDRWPHTHHVHVVEAGGREEQCTLAFRDYLRTHADEARAYEALKRHLAARFIGDTSQAREQYSMAKSDFVERIIALALRGPLPVLVVALLVLSLSAPAAAQVSATRVPQNPLITVASSPTLGGNVNGPTVIRVPDWIERPLGRYYMYFANHMGDFIRLAYADAPTGPWTIYEPGVLHVRDTAFYREQPDPKEPLADFYTHVASPEIVIDHARKRILLWAHGWWTNGERWPADLAAAHAWADGKGYGQYTQVAESTDGLHFQLRAPITRTSYLRVFQHDGWFYALSRLGRLSRARDPLAAFELGPNPFRETAYAGRVRHVALLPRGNQLLVFFTAIGDAPEQVRLSTIDLSGDWSTWRASPATDVLKPQAAYECADLPNLPSQAGDIDVPAQQVRDPFVFDDRGRLFLYYSTCGEQGIAAAELDLH